MPYSKSKLDDLPPSTKSLTKRQKEKFVDVFNALVEEGMAESLAIPLAISQAKNKSKTNKSAVIYKSTDEELMQAVEVIYAPNSLDAHNQWAKPETLRKACENFNANLATGNVKPNLYHVQTTDKFSILKTWINEVPCTIGEQEVPEGAWLGLMQYNDTILWHMKKAGDIQGVSIGCLGRIIKPVTNEDN